MAATSIDEDDNFAKTVKATQRQVELGNGQGPSSLGNFNIQHSISQGDESSKVVNFSQTFLQSLAPSERGKGLYTQTTPSMHYEYDFGASYVPYNTTRAAVRPEKLMKYLPGCNSYEILEHRVELTNLVCSKDDMQSDGRVVTTYGQDSIEIFSDKKGYWRMANITHIDRKKTLFNVNRGFSRVEPGTFEECALPRCALTFSAEHFASLGGDALPDVTRGIIDPYHGLLDVSTWNGSEPFTLSHKLESGRIPVGLFDDIRTVPANRNKLSVANNLLETVWGIQANMANQINRYPILPAKICMLRMVPVLQQQAYTVRRAQFHAKYTAVIKFHYDPPMGAKWFCMGNKGESMQYARDDQLKQCAASSTQYHFGQHPEKFVTPLSGYMIEEIQRQDAMGVDDTSIPQVSPRTSTKRAREEITKLPGITVTDDIRAGTLTGVDVTTIFPEGGDEHVAEVSAEYSEGVLKQVGYTDAELAAIGLEFDAATDGHITDVAGGTQQATISNSGLLVSAKAGPSLGACKLPAEVLFDMKGKSVTSNFNTFRPGEAWKALGYEDEVKSRNRKGFYTPWPKGCKRFRRSDGTDVCTIEACKRADAVTLGTLKEYPRVMADVVNAKQVQDLSFPDGFDYVAKEYSKPIDSMPFQVKLPTAGPPALR